MSAGALSLPTFPDTVRSRSPHRHHVPDVPVAFVNSAFLADSADRVRQRPIPWEGYHRAALISEHELQLLRVQSRADEDMDAHAEVLLSLLAKLARVDTMQYILVLMDDLLEEKKSRAESFLKLLGKIDGFPYGPLLSCLEKDDIFVALKAAKIITFLACTAQEFGLKESTVDPAQRPAIARLLGFLAQHIAASSNPQNTTTNSAANNLSASSTSLSSSAADPVSDISVQLLASVLKIAGARPLFFETAGGMAALLDLLTRRAHGNPQILYECCFCLWEMSFDPHVAAEMDRAYDVVPALMETAKAAIKEKVIRVCVATFRNMIEKAVDANIGSMLVHRLLQFCETLASRKWSDEEISADLAFIMEQLTENFQKLSSFDAYVTEVESKKLDWTPAHQSDEFWRQHAARLNERDHVLVRMLAGLVRESTNPTVLAVACNDLGQYVKFHPAGKKLVDKLSAKERIMQLMTHDDAEVRYQALLAVQKYMVHSWE